MPHEAGKAVTAVNEGQIPGARKPPLSTICLTNCPNWLHNLQKEKLPLNSRGLANCRYYLQVHMEAVGRDFSSCFETLPSKPHGREEGPFHRTFPFTDGETEAQDGEVPQQANSRSRT